MNKKKMQYLLLAVTCSIWGVFAYRIYASYNSSGDYSESDRGFSPADTLQDPAADTFSLLANYRDPFLENEPERKQAYVNPGQTKKTQPVKQVKKEAPWPPITYGGMIRNQDNNKLLAIVHVNGKNNLLNTGDVFEEVKICRILKDSIEVMFGKEKKYVLK